MFEKTRRLAATLRNNTHFTSDQIKIIDAELESAIADSGLNAYRKGESKKITTLVRNSGLDIIVISHEVVPFWLNRETTIEYVTGYGSEFDTHTCTYDWG